MRSILLALLCFAATGIPADGADSGDPVAVVNGVRLERWEAERALQTRVTSNRYHRSIPEETRQRLRLETLDELVLKELKRQWLKAEEIEYDRTAAHAEWTKVRGRFGSDEEYLNALASAGATDETFRRAIARDEAAKAVDLHVAGSVPPATETELREYFEAHSSDFTVPESRHTIHAFYYIPPADSAAADRAEREAAELVERIRSGQSTLKAEAERLRDSLPPRFRDMVGDVGFVHQGSLVAEIDRAVFDADVGSLVGPLRTMYGIHIVEVLEIRAARPMPFAEVRERIDARLRREETASALEKFEEKLKSSADLEYFGWADAG